MTLVYFKTTEQVGNGYKNKSKLTQPNIYCSPLKVGDRRWGTDRCVQATPGMIELNFMTTTVFGVV